MILPPINWFRVAGTVALIVLIGLIGFGAYQFYFCKPTPIIQNTTVQPGGVANFNTQKPEKRFLIFNELGLEADTSREAKLYYRFGVRF